MTSNINNHNMSELLTTTSDSECTLQATTYNLSCQSKDRKVRSDFYLRDRDSYLSSFSITKRTVEMKWSILGPFPTWNTCERFQKRHDCGNKKERSLSTQIHGRVQIIWPLLNSGTGGS